MNIESAILNSLGACAIASIVWGVYYLCQAGLN
jgi:hypothetical protein